jgi:Tat-targeted selenate reductase subunit YnfH
LNSTIQSSVQRAGALVPNYAALQIWRIALLALASAAGSARFAGTKPRAHQFVPRTAAGSAAELIGRGLFYGLHMTVGVAIAG